MYLQKATQFHRREYIDTNKDYELYKDIMVFLISGLKNPVPFFIKARLKITVNGEWLSQEILKCIFQVINTGFF